MECQFCGKSVPTHECVVCSGCNAMVYCCEQHKELHWRHGGHDEECLRMARQYNRKLELVKDLSQSSDRFDSVREFLIDKGLGCPERRSCVWSCLGDAQSSECQPLLWKEMLLQNERNTNIDLDESSCKEYLASWWNEGRGRPSLPWPSEAFKREVADSVVDWQSYCKATHINMEDPILIALDAVMTVWYVAKKYLDDEIEENDRLRAQKPISLVIGILGASAREVNLWPTFLELLSLRSDISWKLLFIGPEIPSWINSKRIKVRRRNKSDTQLPRESVHGESSAFSSSHCHLTMEFYKGTFHELFQSSPGSYLNHGYQNYMNENLNIVVGLNAGVVCYKSWIPTLTMLMQGTSAHPLSGESQATPIRHPHRTQDAKVGDRLLLAITDYNEEALYKSIRMLEHLTAKTQSSDIFKASVPENGCEINPFRQPFLLQPKDNFLPSMSNGFIYMDYFM